MQFARKENSDLVTIKKFIVKIKVGKGKIKLYNLFNGDKALGKFGLLLQIQRFCRYCNDI